MPPPATTTSYLGETDEIEMFNLSGVEAYTGGKKHKGKNNKATIRNVLTLLKREKRYDVRMVNPPKNN